MSVISGTVDGESIALSVSNSAAAFFAQSVFFGPNVQAVTASGTLEQYAVSPGTFVSGIAGASGPPEFGYFVANNAGPVTITGGGVQSYEAPNGNLYPIDPAETFGVLAKPGAVYVTGLSTVSIIVAGDQTGSAIVNDNLSGRLAAFTGTGGNALVGEGLIDAFTTAQGGTDAVLFAAGHAGVQVNSLISYGQDFVNIDASAYGGTQTNTIVATGQGTDLVLLKDGASLSFINSSTAISAIAASAGSNLAVGGTGSTIIIAGTGNETFGFVAANAGESHSVDVIGNFTSQDKIVLSNYSSYTAQVVAGSTVITTPDQSKIIVAGITDPSSVTSRIVIA